MNEYKTCTLCKQNKRLEFFHNDLSAIDGLTQRCAQCRNLLQIAFRQDRQDNTWVSKRKPKLTKDEIRFRRNAYQRRRNLFRVFYNATARAKKAGARIGVFSHREVIRLYGSKCFYCGFLGQMTIDHVVPLGKGGSHTIGNLVSACQRCNSSKKNKLLIEWKKVRGW